MRVSESSSLRFSGLQGLGTAAFALLFGASGLVQAEDPSVAAPAEVPLQRFYIREYRVLGAKEFPQVEVEKAVYSYLGPGRTAEDVEAARAALEKAYRDAGYQAASVLVPEQTGRTGVIFLQVGEGRVANLRVKGSRYFLPSQIKARARSLAEGRVLNFNDVTRDIVALNRSADLQVTPNVRAGEEPGTVDVDLTVVDKFPLHGSVELNNRYSANTDPLRLNASLSYTNLWQAGHTLGASFQVAPQNPEQVKVFSGYYIWQFQQIEWLSVMLQGTKQDSNVSTLGAAAVAGRGEVLGARAIFTLPTGKDFYNSVTLGFDYKHYDQDTMLGTLGAAGTSKAPITYYPVSLSYAATWAPKGSITEFNAGLTAGLRGLGSDSAEFDVSRYGADSSFIYLRSDLSHTHDLPHGFEAFAKVQGQIASQPLTSGEQFGGGGVGSARGYLEAETLGDNALFGTVELRSPSLLGWLPDSWKGNEWRIYAFADAGLLSLRKPLPDQESHFDLASFGVGSTLDLLTYLHGAVDLGVPLISQHADLGSPLTSQQETKAWHPFLSFRVWAEF